MDFWTFFITLLSFEISCDSFLDIVFLGGISHYLMHLCVGHTAWAPEGRERLSQAGPAEGHQLEVGAQQVPSSGGKLYKKQLPSDFNGSSDQLAIYELAGG